MKRCVTFTFPSELVAEPVIYNLGMQFRIVTTILRADISEYVGWMMLEMEGEEEDLEESIAWVTGRGVKVEPADDSQEC
ncbi:NIL domain-containing protein [Chloroflexota bacterium]